MAGVALVGVGLAKAVRGQARLKTLRFRRLGLAVCGLALAVGLCRPDAPARAADECGAGTNVTCTSAGNVYPNGISYSNADQTVTLQSGVIVNSGANVGINLSGSATQTLNIASGVTVNTAGANGINITGASGLVTIAAAGNSVSTSNGLAAYEIISSAGVNATVGGVTLSGSSTFGILIQAGGPASLTTGAVTINGSSAFGIDVFNLGAGANGAITIDTTGGTVSLTGSGAQQAINAQSFNASGGGAVMITTADVSTNSNTADAISATTNGTGANGAITIDTTAGLVDAAGTGSGRGIVATSTASSNSGLVTIHAGNVETHGTGAATAIFASSTSGAVTVTAGDLSTLGVGALGVSASGKGLINITTGNIDTGADNAIGIQATSGLAGAAGLTTIDSTAGTITTLGANATGIAVSSAAGANAVVHAAAIGTTGDNSAGISVLNQTAGGSISITSQSIVTHGSPNAVLLYNNSDAIRAVTNGSGAAGNITIDASQGTGLLETFGSNSNAVRTQSDGGTIDITVGTVRTHGDGSAAIGALILGGTGTLTVTAKGDVSAASANTGLFGVVASGINAVTQGSGDVSVTTKGVSTVADNATAVYAQSSGGMVTVDTTGGTVSTLGGAAIGVVATFNGSSGPASITTASVTTEGNLAH